MGMVENTLFTKKSKSHIIIVQIYVDDIIFGSTSQNLCDDFAKIMHDEFEMSMMRKLNFFLGLQIKQMEDRIFFNQSKYIREMLKKFGLEDSKPTKTPMSTEIKLTKVDEADSMDSLNYQGMIGSLLYLTASRPDIMISVCLCARFQENPKTTHLEAVKRIFTYIRTSHLGLWYPKRTGVEIIVYADSDHAGDYVDRKSTSGVRTIDPSFYNDLSDDSMAKFTAIGFDCLLSLDEEICLSLDELKKTLEKIEPYNSRLPALDDIRNLINRRIVHEKLDKEGNTIHKLPNQIETHKLFDHLRPCELVIRENVYSAIGNRDHTQAVIGLMLFCLQNRQSFNLAYLSLGECTSLKIDEIKFYYMA
ncbi:retrovirus-related pol polyprotein from transposon TNT 1-94 [Tanacetum coccineum]